MKNLNIALKKEIKMHQSVKDFALVVLGSFVLAFGYSIFIVPHHIVPGGIVGLSIVLKELLGVSVGTIALIFNIPLLIWGTKILGRKAGIKTAVSMFSISFFIDGIAYLTESKVYVDDILVSAIFGGILIGLSIPIVMKAGATTGGNDIFVRILMKKINLPYSQLILIIDGIVVFLGVLVFQDFTIAAYCLISIISISKTVDHFLKKSAQNKTILIFSKKTELIKEKIMNCELSSSILDLVHQDSANKMILVVQNPKKEGKIKEMIMDNDEDAFVISLESNLYLK